MKRRLVPRCHVKRRFHHSIHKKFISLCGRFDGLITSAEEGGYVTQLVCPSVRPSVCLFVCLRRCLLDYSKRWERILMQFVDGFAMVQGRTDQILVEIRSLLNCAHFELICRILCYYKIQDTLTRGSVSQQVVNGF